MASLFLLLMSASFVLVIYSALYRAKRQPIQDRAVTHILFTGAGCALASVGCALTAWGVWGVDMPTALSQGAFLVGTALGALGMLGVAVPIFYYLPHIAGQPTKKDMVSIYHQNQMLDAENRRLRAERDRYRKSVVGLKFDRINAVICEGTHDAA